VECFPLITDHEQALRENPGSRRPNNVLLAVQEEVLDEFGQQVEPAGFQLISLPFLDDIRDPVKVEYCPFVDTFPKCPSKELAASPDHVRSSNWSDSTGREASRGAGSVAGCVFLYDARFYLDDCGTNWCWAHCLQAWATQDSPTGELI
jgi:hypothetical protein